MLENARAGADDGIDLALSRDGETTLVQCKRWRSSSIGVSVIREHLGVMASRGISRGIVVCSGRFTKPAVVFARANHIELVDGEVLAALVAAVQSVAPPVVESLAVIACPRCGHDMVQRQAKQGRYAGEWFLGCS